MPTETNDRLGRISRQIPKAVLFEGTARCPTCWKKLCFAQLGGKATGIILWCKSCRSQIMLEIK